MNIDYLKENYTITKLSNTDDLSSFSCGLKDMDNFLIEDALNQQKEHLNVTYLAYCNTELLGFFSLLTDNITVNCIKEKINKTYDIYPAVKIGRFAINKKYQSMGFGTILLDNTCKNIQYISKKVGIRFITIDAYCKVVDFYFKNEFKNQKIKNIKKLKRTAKRNEKTTIPLYKDIKRL